MSAVNIQTPSVGSSSLKYPRCSFVCANRICRPRVHCGCEAVQEDCQYWGCGCGQEAAGLRWDEHSLLLLGMQLQTLKSVIQLGCIGFKIYLLFFVRLSRFPCAHNVVARHWNSHDRAHRVGGQGWDGPLLRRSARHPTGDRRHRGGKDGLSCQPA